jgi:hypothetical protein
VIAVRWAAVILGTNAPLVVEVTSSIAEGSAAAPVPLILTPFWLYAGLLNCITIKVITVNTTLFISVPGDNLFFIFLLFGFLSLIVLIFYCLFLYVF